MFTTEERKANGACGAEIMMIVGRMWMTVENDVFKFL